MNTNRSDSWITLPVGHSSRKRKLGIAVRLVRSGEEFRRVQRYIEWNPVKAPPGKAASRQECPPYG